MWSLNRFARASAALIVAAVMAACNNPVTGGVHVIPDGFAILEGGNALVQGEGGRSQQPTVTGQLSVTVSEERGPLVLRFTDSDGSVMTPPQGYFIDVRTAGAAGIARWHPAPDEMSGTLVGQAPGTTTLRFRWMHGPPASAHEETAWTVTVVVTPGES